MTRGINEAGIHKNRRGKKTAFKGSYPFVGFSISEKGGKTHVLEINMITYGGPNVMTYFYTLYNL